MSLRVGLGFDSHRLEAGRPCRLGGLDLPCEKGPVGHSDGDAVLHAVCDALLGAAGLDDLGTLYSDRDARWKGADSGELLRDVIGRVRGAGWRAVNLDVVIATDGPRIAPHRAALRARLAQLADLEPDAVNVKGKSLEGLPASDDVVAVQAVCLIERA